MCDRLDAAGLALYKRPERLEVVDALPATASGKIQKHELVRALTVGADRDTADDGDTDDGESREGRSAGG
jgi:acyl-coenzyme A synthetase/AMP-(fatty) acid ligase